MADATQQELATTLLDLLPKDLTFIANATLFERFALAAREAGFGLTGEDSFKQARDALLSSGQAIKGKGRGGSTARAHGSARPDFDLQAEPVTPDLLANPPSVPPVKPAKARAATQAAQPDEPQVLSYRYPDRRKNNPEVGLVNEASDPPDQPKTVYRYDPHLDPALQFDGARAKAETLIEAALAGDDPAAMRAALEELRRLSAPYLQWTGKAERTSFEVDTVSLHVHERIDAMTILSAVNKRQSAIIKIAASENGKGATSQKGLKHSQGFQPGLFEAPFESLPYHTALDFYKHDRGWANRLVAGDSLLVMNSLLQKEGMAGQVQMIYIDPPYGIKYGSNFQPFTNKRDVKDRSDADLTQEPEMIKAFRDTWELGIHSYLTYLRDRLLLAKDLLSETGSVFVQISEENYHWTRQVMDDVFGAKNSVVSLIVKKKSATTPTDPVNDYIVWYAKNRNQLMVNPLYAPKITPDEDTKFNTLISEAGIHERAKSLSEIEIRALLAEGWRWARVNYPLVSQDPSERSDDFESLWVNSPPLGAVFLSGFQKAQCP